MWHRPCGGVQGVNVSLDGHWESTVLSSVDLRGGCFHERLFWIVVVQSFWFDHLDGYGSGAGLIHCGRSPVILHVIITFLPIITDIFGESVSVYSHISTIFATLEFINSNSFTMAFICSCCSCWNSLSTEEQKYGRQLLWFLWILWLLPGRSALVRRGSIKTVGGKVGVVVGSNYGCIIKTWIQLLFWSSVNSKRLLLVSCSISYNTALLDFQNLLDFPN